MNSRVEVATNSGSPSVANSSGMPNVTKIRRRQLIRPVAPSLQRSIIGQFE